MFSESDTSTYSNSQHTYKPLRQVRKVAAVVARLAQPIPIPVQCYDYDSSNTSMKLGNDLAQMCLESKVMLLSNSCIAKHPEQLKTSRLCHQPSLSHPG